MKKPKHIEDLIKRAIRDEIALHPLKSVAQIRSTLFRYGYQALDGPLDWHYIARLMRVIRKENLESLTNQSRDERLANLKERHRIVTQKLADILDGKPTSIIDKTSYPTHAERIVAANTILKWDMAIFFAEEQSQSALIEEEVARKIVQPMVLTMRNRETSIPVEFGSLQPTFANT
jgi:hypothetical protein